MQKYNKFIVAIIGGLVAGITLFYGGTPDWLQLILPFLTALGVYTVPNK